MAVCRCLPSPCTRKHISRIKKIKLCSRSELSRSWLWLRCRSWSTLALAEDDVLNNNCRSADSTTEVENELEVIAVDTGCTYYLDLIILVSYESRTNVNDDRTVIILCTKLDCHAWMILCRVKHAIEVIGLICRRAQACVLEEELALPLQSAKACREHKCMSATLRCELSIVNRLPIIICKPVVMVSCHCIVPEVVWIIWIKCRLLRSAATCNLALADHDTLHCNGCSSREPTEVEYELEVRNVCSRKSCLDVLKFLICCNSDAVVIEELVHVSRVTVAVLISRMLPARLDCSRTVVCSADDSSEVVSLVW